MNTVLQTELRTIHYYLCIQCVFDTLKRCASGRGSNNTQTLADNSLDEVECSAGVWQALSVTMPLLSVKDLHAVATFNEQSQLKMSRCYAKKG